MQQEGLEVYDKEKQGVIYSPFNLQVEEMKHLFLINIEKDPDSIYTGFEPQAFEDEEAGEGIGVIAYRKDGFVDIYGQPSLRCAENSGVTGNGLADYVVRDMTDAIFTINETGVTCYVAFEDKIGRKILLNVQTSSLKLGKPFDLLAPVGASSASPTELPAFFLYDFAFVPRAKTKVHIQVEDRVHKADKFPIPIDGMMMYFMRYAKDPFLVKYNEAQHGKLLPLEPIEGEKNIYADALGTLYVLEEKEGHQEIKQMYRTNRRHKVQVDFSPAIPDMLCLKDKVVVRGDFSISSESSLGNISGVYSVEAKGKKVEIVMQPRGGWQPNEKRITIKFIYKLVKIFKEWPKTYEWRAMIETEHKQALTIESIWKRIN